MCPESGLRTAPNWPKIQKMIMMSQFPDMTPSSTFFDVVLFFLSSLVTGPSFMSTFHWFWNYDNFPLEGIDQKSRNWKYPRLSFAQYLATGASYGDHNWHECF